MKVKSKKLKVKRGILLLLIITLLSGARVYAQDACGMNQMVHTCDSSGMHHMVHASGVEPSSNEAVEGLSRLEDNELNLIMGRMLVANIPEGEYKDARIVLWDEWKMKDVTNINHGSEGIGNHSINTLSFTAGGK